MAVHALGVSWTRRDAFKKVTGEAAFTGDIRLPDCLVGKTLRSPYPHARILNINTSRAMKLSGVYAVITAKDLPAKRFGTAIGDQPVLARKRVRFAGERVAALAAVDEQTALEALDLIKVEYEPLPFQIDPSEAMRDHAVLLHPKFITYHKARQDITIPNVVDWATYGIGDLATGFSLADFTYDHTFRTQVVHQGYLEPHTCMVHISHDKTIHVWSNNKTPYPMRNELAELLSIPIDQIEVHFGYIGGDFGGKEGLMDEPVCYYLALLSHHPVRMAMTTAEELMAANPRHASMITVKSGVQKDGTLVARQVDVIFDAGAYAGANANPLVGGLRRALGAYRIPHTRINGYAVYTNSVPAGHCRAPGDPQVFFAVESHTDMIAHDLGLDPYQFRLSNVLREGDISPSGLRWRDINAQEVLTVAMLNSNWGRPKPNPFTGYGLALTERTTGIGGSAAIVTVHADGSATVVSGSTDPGTGSSTVMRQILAYELQIPVEKVSFAGGNTALAPFDNGSGSSRVTHITGQAVQAAAQDTLNQLKRLAALQLKITEDEVTYQDGVFSGPDKPALSLVAVLSKAGKAKNVIMGRGHYMADSVDNTCFSAQVAEVEVDPDTGQVTVKRIVSANDIGLALNPLAVQSQVEGAVVQSTGFALTENLPRPGGQPTVKTLADYKMATALDAPVVESYLVEGAPGSGPYGAKSIGEQPMAAVAPAIANAIYDAVGVRLTELPLSPEKLAIALRDSNRQKAGENL